MTETTNNQIPLKPGNKNGKKVILLLAVLFSLPYLFAFAYFQYKDAFPQSQTTNHGDLISPVRAITQIPLIGRKGEDINAFLKKKWVLLTVAKSSCDEVCQANLYHIRQIHRGMSGDGVRVEKLLVLSDSEDLSGMEGKLKDYPNIRVATGSAESVQAFIQLLKDPNEVVENGIYMIDPLGNYMMSYPAKFDANLIIKDLERLLKVSQVG